MLPFGPIHVCFILGPFVVCFILGPFPLCFISDPFLMCTKLGLYILCFKLGPFLLHITVVFCLRPICTVLHLRPSRLVGYVCHISVLLSDVFSPRISHTSDVINRSRDVTVSRCEPRRGVAVCVRFPVHQHHLHQADRNSSSPGVRFLRPQHLGVHDDPVDEFHRQGVSVVAPPHKHTARLMYADGFSCSGLVITAIRCPGGETPFCRP